MKITASPNLENLAGVEITATITMKLHEWESIAEALRNGKSGYFGTPQKLLDHLTQTIGKYKSGVVCEPVAQAQNDY